jgi:chemotaxis methyl-accepting protein methylase
MTQVAISPEISNAVNTIYGDNGLSWLEYHAAEQPQLSQAELVANFRQEPCSQDTRFFRHRGLIEGFVAYVAPELVEEDGKVSVTNVGASGEEAWSLSIALQDGHVPYDIAGYNVNREALERAHGPFNISLDEINRQSGLWIGVPTLSRYLKESTDGVRPRTNISNHATFDRHDILQGPVPGAVSNTLVMNNVLWHYPEQTRGHIMANALRGLRPGGAFIFEGWTSESRQAPGYGEWVRDLFKYGMWPYRVSSVNSVLRYYPDEASVPFEQSAAVNEALGILAAVREEK